MWKTFVVAWIGLAVTTAADPNYCCGSSLVLLINDYCPGTQESISQQLCSRTGAFMIPLIDESYEIDFSTGELSIYRIDELVPKEKYCLAKTKHNNEETQMALVCLDVQEIQATKNTGIGVLETVICCFISIFFLGVTLGVYGLLPELRDLQGKCLMSSVSSLLLAFLLLATVQLSTQVTYAACVALAMLLYFFFLSVFFWLNVVSFNVWRSSQAAIPTWLSSADERRLFIFYNAYGWGAPLIMLLISVACHFAPGNHLHPHFGLGICWFGGKTQIWAYFYGPISVLLVANIIMFVATAWSLWRRHRDCSQRHLKSHKFKFLLYLKLFFIMGICWTFEPLSMVWENVNLWLITDYVNALQGVFIFLLLVVFRKRTRRGLARTGFCCFRPLSTWTAIDANDDEECDSNAFNEVEETPNTAEAQATNDK